MSAIEVLNGVGADIASDQFRRRGRGISGMADHTDAGPLFAAVRESVVGTFETCGLRRAMSEFEGKAENICSY